MNLGFLQKKYRQLWVTKATVIKWILSESFPCYGLGSHWQFKKSIVDAWVKSAGAKKLVI